jgi:hypothetical protein
MITTPEPSKPGFGGFGVLLRVDGAEITIKRDKGHWLPPIPLSHISPQQRTERTKRCQFSEFSKLFNKIEDTGFGGKIPVFHWGGKTGRNGGI